MDINEVKSILNRKFRGSSIDDVQGISDWSLFKEAAGNLLSELDPLETVRVGNITLYDGIYDYSPPSDLKGKKIIDRRPQADRYEGDSVTNRGIEQFDQDKDDFTVEFRDATKVLRTSKNLNGSLLLTGFDSDDDFSVGGGATNLTEDTLYYTQGTSLNFDVGATGGYIEGTFDAVDLSLHEDISTFFVRVYIPDPTILTSIALRVGSTSANYVSVTKTAPFFGTFKAGWNWVNFDWNGATETGTVDAENIAYTRITLVTTSADTDIRVDELYSKLPNIYEFPYYSRFLFRSTAGAFLEIPTSDDDLVNLDVPAQNIFTDECCRLVARGLTRGDDEIKYTNDLYGQPGKLGKYDRYRQDQPSEALRQIETYYEM